MSKDMFSPTKHKVPSVIVEEDVESGEMRLGADPSVRNGWALCYGMLVCGSQREKTRED